MVNRVTQPFNKSYAVVVLHIFTFMRSGLYLLSQKSTVFTSSQDLTRGSSRKALETKNELFAPYKHLTSRSQWKYDPEK